MKINPVVPIGGRMLPVLALSLLLGTLATGCKKSDDVKPTENAITSYLSGESTITSGNRTSGPWELGVVFSASVAGRITQVGSQMPDPGSYRIVIWDFDTKQLLRQKTVEQSSPAALTLTPNKKYVISINSQSAGVNKKYAFAAKTGGAEFMPFTKGNILVYNSCYSGVATATFPAQVPNVKYELYGYPEFTFVAD